MELRELFDPIKFNPPLYTRSQVEGFFKDYELTDYLTTEQINVINESGIWSKDKLAKKIVDNLSANGINILINTNASAGQTVMHTHVHIIPRYDENDTIKIAFTENKYDLDEVLNKINK